MTDSLIGVIFGGLIASIAPLMTLIFGERRWKFEARLSALKSERQRVEELYEKNLQLFGEGAKINRYPSNMISDILVLMPKEIGDMFEAYMKDECPSELKKNHFYLELASAMNRDLKLRDDAILRLLSK